LTINSGKIYGPKQCGGLYAKTFVELEPQMLGGGQEHGMRSGTENLASIVGFTTAWQEAKSLHKQEAKRLSEIRDNFVKTIEAKIPQIVINGPMGSKRLANNLNICIPGQDNERLLMVLDEAGFQVAVGSACSASSEEASHVLKAMGIPDKDARSSLRISFGRYTTEESAKSLAESLIKVVAQN
jgi:cysteine desulfurase